MLGFVTIPTDFVASVAGQATTIVGDLAPVATLAIGIFLGLIVLDWLISVLRRKDDNQDKVE